MRRPLAIIVFAQAAGAVMSLLSVPFCAQILGPEAAGILGLSASFQIVVFLLDGCNTVTRMVALHSTQTAGTRLAAALVAYAERVYLKIAAFGSIVCILGALPLAQLLESRSELPVSVMGPALALVGANAFLKLLASQYRGGVVGLQAQVTANMVALGANTVRFPLAVLATLLIPDLRFLLVLQTVSFLLEAALLRRALQSRLPRISAGEIATGGKLWFEQGRFLAITVGLATLGAAASQADKFFLAAKLNLADFGAVSLVTLLSAGLFVLATPIHQIFLPRLATAKDTSERQRTQIALLTVLWCFCWPVMATAAMAAEPLARLVSPSGSFNQALLAEAFVYWGVGNGLAVISTGLYLTFFATGNLRRYALVQGVVLMVYLPAAWVSLETYGVSGAGIAFLACQLVLLILLGFAMRTLGFSLPRLAPVLILPTFAIAGVWIGRAAAGPLPAASLAEAFSSVAVVFLLSLGVCISGFLYWARSKSASPVGASHL